MASQSISISELKTQNRFQKFDKILSKQLPVIAAYSREHGQILIPIYVWVQTRDVLYGHCLVSLARQNPQLKHTIIELSFDDSDAAEAGLLDHLLAQPYLILWEKLELSLAGEPYWELKEIAKRNQGIRNDLRKEQKSPSRDVNQIIAEKIGCSPTTVSHFKTIFFSGRKKLIEACRKGDIAIDAAYKRVSGKTSQNPKPDNLVATPDAKTVKVLMDCDVFDECENNIDVGKKHIMRQNGIVPGTAVIVEKVQKAKIADGKIWLAWHKELGCIQVIKKTEDKSTGDIRVKIDSYNCEFKESVDGIYLFEADRINGAPLLYNKKDESDFENACKECGSAAVESAEGGAQ